MRVLIASDSFGSSLSAEDACKAIATGWANAAPHDRVDILPLSDGGPGFVSVMSRLTGAKTLEVPIHSPLGSQITASIVIAGESAFIESAQACGRNLIDDTASLGVRCGSTFGVGELVARALDIGGIKKIVVGLGGSGTNDGGAGLLSALGATPSDLLNSGGAALGDVSEVNVDRPRERSSGVELLIATDVDNPLTGPQGATEVYAPQKGATVADVAELEAALTHFAAITDPALSSAPGSGAAGGLGFGFMLIGASRRSGIELVSESVSLDQAIARSDLVITGEGSFDWQSLRGKVIAGVSHTAAKLGKPVVVIAGQVLLARREFLGLGVESAYAVAQTPTEVANSLADPVCTLIRRAESVARTWSPASRTER
ncbi:MAG TPA: glycerate kinase [Candidatus Nanopelagicaceae bacterium]|nr:glycerate kinase [Candidatus Nanopelagicaceae bacterium]